MQLFRKLAGNIFFKIILAFIALSFVLFGVSDFILNGPNSWVAKIGGKTISQTAFMKEMQKNREMILQTNNSEEALKYLDSEQFKSDILNRMVNSVIIEKLSDNLGVQASKNLILQEVAKDQNFKDKDGKFDRSAFQNFLKKNGINEEQYVKIVQDEVVASIVVQSLAAAAPADVRSAVTNAEFKQQTRLADVVKITMKDVAKVATPSEADLTNFFEKNKQNYAAAEMRKVSYLKFSRKDFAKDMAVGDDEIAAEYEKNKDQFQRPESRNLYHILFDNEAAAKDFIQKLDAAVASDKSKFSSEFAKLAKEIQKKSPKDIALNKVVQKDIMPELANVIFKLSLNERSDVVKSPLGFHVFLLNEITKSQPIALAEVKDAIKNQLLQGRQDKVLQAKVSEIDDVILASNSLSETAQKFSLKINDNAVLINQTGQNKNGAEVSEIKSLEGFAANAFTAAKGQASKLFYSKISDEFYSIKVEEIEAAHEKKFEEVKSQVMADLIAKIQYEKLQEFATKVGDEISKNPSEASQIAAKYKLSVEKNREFPRIFYINYQGRQIPYASKFLEELFSIKIGEATGVNSQGIQEFTIGVLRSIKQPSISEVQIANAKKESENVFRNGIAQGYNSFMLKKYPIKVNDKFFAKKEEAK